MNRNELEYLERCLNNWLNEKGIDKKEVHEFMYYLCEELEEM